MRIVIAGGTGFLGTPLAAALASDGADVVVLTRGSRSASAASVRTVVWQPGGQNAESQSAIDGAAAVVNLAGESIAGRRWSAAHKQRILDSRIQATRSLVDAIHRAAAPPPVFVSGSAVGYYGALGDDIATETTPPGSDFLARVCVQWEQEAVRAHELTASRTRVVLIRTGLVLERSGGALPQMLPPFTLGVGGPLGSGRQYWPWIHRADWIAMVRWAIATSRVAGALNVTAPAPATNAEFARALGRALHRPAFLPAPGFALKLLLGEMAEPLLLSGQRAVPAKAEREGFTFRFDRLENALAAIFSRRPTPA
jgi:uncharacterized protein